jgi:hypothetical protein
VDESERREVDCFRLCWKESIWAASRCITSLFQRLEFCSWVEFDGSMEGYIRAEFGIVDIVTYSRVLFRWNFISTPKLNTLQLNTVSNSPNTRAHPTSTISENKLLTLHQNFWSPICSVHNPDRHPLSQSCLHELTFLQSRTLQTHQDNPSSGYWSTCTAEQHLSV